MASKRRHQLDTLYGEIGRTLPCHICRVVPQSYLNAAARTDASLVKFPPASMQPHSQPNAFTSGQQAALVALNSKEAGTSQAASMPAKAIGTEAAETAQKSGANWTASLLQQQ